LPFAELVWVVEVGEVAAGEASVTGDQGRDDFFIDAIADIALTLESNHVLEATPGWNDDRGGEVVGVAVLVGDVFDEQHEQNIVLVLAGIHAATQFITGSPEGRVKVRFLNGHWSCLNLGQREWYNVVLSVRAIDWVVVPNISSILKVRL